MDGKYRTGVSSRKAIVSNDKNARIHYTLLTDRCREIGLEQQVSACHRMGQPRSRGIVPQKKYIIVIEPDDLILGLLERWLGEADYTVVARAAQSLPLAVGDDEEPCLVVIDVPTPRSAEKIIKSVREMYAGPILVISARFRRGTGSEVARQLGVRMALPKPFTRDELLAAVGESISSH